MDLTLIFGAVFIAAALVFAGASLFLTEKLKDLMKAKTKAVIYLVAFISSGLIVWVTYFLGSSAVFSILVGIGYTGTAPNIPPEAMGQWVYFLLLHILSFLLAGGIYDWRKLLPNKK